MAAQAVRGNIPDQPPTELIFRRRLRLGAMLRELWDVKELVWSLTERAFRVRYKQAWLGFAWAVLTPLALMLVFSIFVAKAVNVDTQGVPYPLYAYLGLLPWTFFSTSVSMGGTSLVSNAALLNKIYAPREIFPLSSVGVAGLDTAIASTVLVLLFVVFTFLPAATSVWVPLLLLLMLVFVLGAVLLTSITVVYLRDLRHALPILLQLGLFATPVAYGIEVIPHQFQGAYAFLNPLAPVIDGLRQTVLFGNPPLWNLFAVGAAGALVYLILGLWLFKRLETGIADVA